VYEYCEAETKQAVYGVSAVVEKVHCKVTTMPVGYKEAPVTPAQRFLLCAAVAIQDYHS
jgi:hypothetical protein